MNGATTFDFGQFVGLYVQLRDKIKVIEDKHEEELKPFKDKKVQLEAMLQNALNETGQESAKTTEGTVYKRIKRSATIENKSEFTRFVIADGLWDLVDWKANVTAVEDFLMKENQLPPGVKISSVSTVGVRRS